MSSFEYEFLKSIIGFFHLLGSCTQQFHYFREDWPDGGAINRVIHKPDDPVVAVAPTPVLSHVSEEDGNGYKRPSAIAQR